MSNLNVLLVDDDSEESYLFNEVLEHIKLNVSLVRADNANNFLDQLYNQLLPDLVFMDLNMPYKDGMEALTEIRNNEKFKNLPLIIYSNIRNKDKIDDCFNKGANLFVVKPNDFDGMVKVVKKVFMIDWKSFPVIKRDKFVIYPDRDS